MNKGLRYGVLACIAFFALFLSACTPGNDILADYSVNADQSIDVNVPFDTSPAVYQTLAPNGAKYTIQPENNVKIVGWLNEMMDETVKNQYTQLAVGSLGTNVKNLQKRLIELGYLDGIATGTYDQATAQAVKLFESAYNQVPTGKASQLMQVYLFSDNAKTYSANKAQTQAPNQTGKYVKLQRGNSGSNVASLQNRLAELGYLTGAATGIFDAATENAVKDFESAYGRQRTGIATEEMQKYLYSDSAYPAWRTTPTPTPFNVTPTPTPSISDMYPPLQYGSSGADVRNLQTRLKFLGYYTGSIDGIYGNGTVKAVKAFEKAYGKSETGVATSNMQAWLFSDTAISYEESLRQPTPTPVLYNTLSKGSYGEEVAALQRRLIQLGYLSGAADGYFGDNTEKAVRAFEARYGKLQTGVATPDMQRYLFADGALKNNGTSVSQAEYMALGEGSYGTSVYALEMRLIELKYQEAPADGHYDAETAAAVRAFESAHGRVQTGIASVALQELLFSESAKPNANYVSPSSEYKTLQNGDKSDAVAKLQKRLIQLGYLTGTVDGYYGDGTEAAIRTFESACGLSQTGVATALVQTRLYSENALPNPSGDIAVSYATLQSGDSGDAVRALQKRLIELGYLTGSADGKFGNATQNAVKAFQKALGLKQTGVAGAALQKELYSASAPGYSINTGDIVNVNKSAVVNSRTTVYDAPGSSKVRGTLNAGTEVFVLRTAGQWAEIRNANGDVGYAYLSNISYNLATPTPTLSSATIVTVNKTAIVNESGIVVYKSASEQSQPLGSLKKGSSVLWLRTNGDWAEVKNSSGDIGYMNKKYLTVSQSSGSAQTAYPSLKTGNTGESVKNIQRRLKELGYFDGDIGGNYLTKTTSAVKAFQAAIGMKQTGEATSALQEILFSSAAPRAKQYATPSSRSYPALSYGDKNEYVGEMQLQLIDLGYLKSSNATYGTFDAATRDALINVQVAMGFLNANGVASPEIQAFLTTEAARVLKR